MTHNPAEFPPVEQWPMVAPPDCPTCRPHGEVVWIGPATSANGAEVNVWHCRTCRAQVRIPVTHWPVLDGPDCPYCRTPVTCWAALAPDHAGDLWLCQHGHEFVLTPEGLIIPAEDAA